MRKPLLKGTKWFGKGAADGAWHLNFQIPFYKSVRITAFHPAGTIQGYYWIVRGVIQQPNIPLRIGNFELPFGAKMKMIETKPVEVPAFGKTFLSTHTHGVLDCFSL